MEKSANPHSETSICRTLFHLDSVKRDAANRNSGCRIAGHTRAGSSDRRSIHSANAGGHALKVVIVYGTRKGRVAPRFEKRDEV